FGFIITALVYAIGKVSGCHINPAVTFALAVTRRFPWREVPVYWIAQYVGAAIGAFGIWGVFGANPVTFGMGQTHFAPDASTAYDYLANPRHVEQPIEEAVSHEEAPAHVAAAH